MSALLLRGAALAVIASLLVPLPAAGQLSVVQGPVEADVIRVLDGDSFQFISFPFPEMAIRGILRVDGIDMPEKRGKCQQERQKAQEATAFSSDLIKSAGNRVKLSVIGLQGEDGGGFGRYRAVVTVNGKNLGDELIRAGLARENHGEKRKPWCNIQ